MCRLLPAQAIVARGVQQAVPHAAAGAAAASLLLRVLLRKVQQDWLIAAGEGTGVLVSSLDHVSASGRKPCALSDIVICPTMHARAKDIVEISIDRCSFCHLQRGVLQGWRACNYFELRLLSSDFCSLCGSRTVLCMILAYTFNERGSIDASAGP